MNEQKNKKGECEAEFGLFDPVRYVFSNRKAAAIGLAVFVLLVFGNAFWLANKSFVQTQPKPVGQGGLADNGTTTRQIVSNIGNGDQNLAPALPEPSGDINDIVGAIADFMAKEDAIAASENEDAKLVLADRNSLDGFGTIYSHNGANFCANLAQTIAGTKLKIIDRESSLAVAQAGKLNKIIGNRNSRDNNLEAQRSMADSQLDRNFGKMNLLAEGSSQKLAAAIFKDSAIASIAGRRQAIDSAKTSFRNSLDQIFQQQMASIKNAVSAYESAINSLLAQAEFDCKNGQDSVAVANRVQNNSSGALAAFISQKAQIESQNADSFVSARATAQKSAGENFNSAIRQATAAFQAAQF
jgi:hypothetical protein